MTTEFMMKVIEDFKTPKDVPSTYAYLEIALKAALAELRTFMKTPLQPLPSEYLREGASFDYELYADLISMIRLLRNMVDEAIKNGGAHQLEYSDANCFNIYVVYFDNQTIEITLI